MADPTAGPIVLGEEVIFASGRTVPGPFQTQLLTNHISRYASGPGIKRAASNRSLPDRQ